MTVLREMISHVRVAGQSPVGHPNETASATAPLRPYPRRRTDAVSLAHGPLWALASGVALCLYLASERNGYHGDELYFLAAGRRLDWGYADQPSLLPVLARAADTAFGGSLPALRLPAMAITTAGLFVTAMIARELGGRRRAQIAAGATYAVSPYTLANGWLLVTATIDAFLWALTTLLLIRWVRRRNDRLLLWTGLVSAIAVQVKYLIVVFWIVLLASVLLNGPRDLLRRHFLWAGALLAMLSVVPSLFWQSRHGWPQWHMTTVIPGEVDGLAGGRLAFLPLTVLTAGVVVGGVLVSYGLWRLLRSPRLRSYRFLAWTSVGVTAIFLVTGGRYYYCAGLFPLCWAAAAAELEQSPPSPWWRWLPTWRTYLLSAALILSLTVVAKPSSWIADANLVSHATAGWQDLTRTVSRAHRSLPRHAHRHAVLITEHYWQASALDRFRRGTDLPTVHSPHRGYWYFGAPPDDSDAVLFVGTDPAELRPHFREVHQLAVHNGELGFPGVNRNVSVWLCTERRTPWSQLWPALRNL